ncbi:lecithin retinol acyltransferase family protein [Shewanella litorisediminis]|uniref:Lecithin retinol acyltransferase family protein n=1 Tax=Shewanella litorisediminis TaxID=1173586 RepID=A0ABX7G028_9GAMM|nr:lecithin retinol acyltransferase family protein [Shewanella litorisediminis]MCL2918275.1 lecithin retinol acyltransferase family protein [Shewanella litorisediminis]QRH00676.1 lecithin retinol acyltransferase family protein [Shewanella litorisediminis]
MPAFFPGDHLVTNIDIPGLTEHHGLYIGHETLIHLSKDGSITEISLISFAGEQEARCIDTAEDSERAISRAKSKLGQHNYQLFHNNCEHFVNWCLDKPYSSDQVSNLTHLVAQGIARSGLAGEVGKRVAGGPLATTALVSTSAKLAADYLGAPKKVSTLIGYPGDMVAKPIETLINGGRDTLDDTVHHLQQAEFGEAAKALLTGSAKTLAKATIVTPAKVTGHAIKTVAEIGRDIWWWLRY